MKKKTVKETKATIEEVIQQAISIYKDVLSQEHDTPFWHQEHLIDREDNDVKTYPDLNPLAPHIKSKVLQLATLFPFVKEWRTDSQFCLTIGTYTDKEHDHKVVVRSYNNPGLEITYDLFIGAIDRSWFVELEYSPVRVIYTVVINSDVHAREHLHQVPDAGIEKLLQLFQKSMVFGCRALRQPK